jgi:DNA-directed RNA polymerase subunit RPC12/RpoP
MLEFKCALCEQTFTTKWSEEEAKAEFAEVFPNDNIEETELVCEDCYRKIGF